LLLTTRRLGEVAAFPLVTTLSSVMSFISFSFQRRQAAIAPTRKLYVVRLGYILMSFSVTGLLLQAIQIVPTIAREANGIRISHHLNAMSRNAISVITQIAFHNFGKKTHNKMQIITVIKNATIY